MSTYERTFKRVVDVLGASALLFLGAPIMLVAALSIIFDDGRPVLFRQHRVGAHGREFSITKFRTYPTGTLELESAASGSLRPTRVGRILRRTSLDELPQLFNVIAGNMSLVGPRPALPSQSDVLEPRIDCGAVRLRPGMTGLAQIMSYDGMPPEVKTKFDCTYGQRVHLLTDLAILLKTARYVVTPPPMY